MRNLNTLLLFVLIFSTFGFNNALSALELKEVGSRGWFTTLEPFAEFDPNHSSVEIWTPSGEKKAPIMVYAHGGAGYREDDHARVLMFRRHGFATISFDAYEMNGFEDWNFVTRKIINKGKQNMIWGVFKGAVEYAAKNNNWDNRNIFLYGGSNGARVVLYSATELANNSIRGVIAEAPAANGYPLGYIKIPTIIPFGKMDNWAGRSETDYIWTRTYPSSPISLEQWVKSLQEKGRPIEFTFYENAGHLLFSGPLKKVTLDRANGLSFTAYQGADEEVVKQYERDIFRFVNSHLIQ